MRAMIPQRAIHRFFKSPRTGVTVFVILWGWKDSVFPAAYEVVWIVDLFSPQTGWEWWGTCDQGDYFLSSLDHLDPCHPLDLNCPFPLNPCSSFLPCFSFLLSSFFFQKSLRELSSSRLSSSILELVFSRGPNWPVRVHLVQIGLGRPSCQLLARYSPMTKIL